MKCIHCGRISRLRERTRGRCPGCGHRFAFDPQARPAAGTDAEFQEAIDRVSSGGQLRFTTRQLWHAVNGKPTMPPPPGGGGCVVAGALFCGLPGVAMALLGDMPGLLIMAVLGGAAGAAMGWGAARTEMERWADRLRPRLPYDIFLRSHLPQWVKVHGDVPGLLSPLDTDAAAAPRQVPADAAAFDCAVVTDRWSMARMLVANGFHLQHNCAVLSRDGYPKDMAGALREALRRTPRLTVFALHDASPGGCRLPLDLREPEWFPDPSVRIVDLGLRPGTVRRLGLPWLPGKRLQAAPEWLDNLLPHADLEWLVAGNVYELAAVPPAQLMRAVYEGMVAAGPHDGAGGDPAYDAHWPGAAVWFGTLAPGGGGDTAAEGSRTSHPPPPCLAE